MFEKIADQARRDALAYFKLGGYVGTFRNALQDINGALSAGATAAGQAYGATVAPFQDAGLNGGRMDGLLRGVAGGLGGFHGAGGTGAVLKGVLPPALAAYGAYHLYDHHVAPRLARPAHHPDPSQGMY